MRGSVEMTSVLASRTFDQFHLHYIWFYCLSKQVQKDRIKKKKTCILCLEDKETLTS